MRIAPVHIGHSDSRDWLHSDGGNGMTSPIDIVVAGCYLGTHHET
jgi:hypothetical protein